MKNNFRNDINGLRAIAVIAVVLFHFKPTWVPGGFAGVDVFFVISGFLMTGIIFRGLEEKNFSILKFYMARANRIIPALALLCLILLIFGWFYLTPIEYRALGKHTATSISFLSNFIYWLEAGYFDKASHEKWLLHTWSLSVEWQFYIIYPLVLVAMRKLISIKTMKFFLGLGTVIGFIFCIIATSKWPNPSYYLLPTRAWELMIGGMAYLYPLSLKTQSKKFVELLGISLIIGSYFTVSAENPWPGYLAIFPVLGSFLMIQAHRNNSIITNNFLFQKLGTWSYSIYLWHWPLVVLIFSFSLAEYYIYLGIMLSIFLGFLSYKFIETINLKNDFPNFFSYFKSKPIFLAGTIAIVGCEDFITNGFIWHYPKNIIAIANEENDKNPYNCMIDNKFPCHIGKKNNIKAIIVGDSHADSLATSLANVFNLKSEGIIVLTKASCPLILNIRFFESEDECLKENIKRMQFLKNEYPNIPIFWVARTASYIYGETASERINSIKDTLPEIYFYKKYTSPEKSLLNEFEYNLDKTIQSLVINRPVYIVLPTPEMKKNVPRHMAKELLLGKKNVDIYIEYNEYINRNKTLIEIMNHVAENNSIELLDPTPYLCNKHKCKAIYKNLPIYYDGDHMNEYGNKLLTNMFRNAIYRNNKE